MEIEKHFLADLKSGVSKFVSQPWYNPDGDCIVFQTHGEAVVAKRIDDLLTIYNSAIDERPIGFQIKGVKAIIEKFGIDGLVVQSVIDREGVKSVSIAALLLAAYEKGESSVERRLGYAKAVGVGCAEQSIPADEILKPAA